MIGETWKIGAVKVTRIVEVEMLGGMNRIIPEATRPRVAGIQWLIPHFADADGRMRGSIHALVIDTGSRRIVVDTCLGNDKERENPVWNRMSGPFLEELATAGYPAASIDTVLCTHLHVDHVGWNTRLVDGKWVPTFPNARYLLARTEYEYWQANSDGDRGVVFADSVQPVFDAGLVDLVGPEHVVCPEVKLVPTAGHTPGHVSVAIESQGATAFVTGDILHHPCQLAHPEWGSPFDSDSNAASLMRRGVFERYADTQTLVIGTHFATPTAGRVRRDGAAFRLEVN